MLNGLRIRCVELLPHELDHGCHVNDITVVSGENLRPGSPSPREP